MSKTRVLFLCIGNSCRSPMAEGFANKYGSDVLSAQSAGLGPAMTVDVLTNKVMAEKNIDLSESFPKGLNDVDPGQFDLVINMSGRKLPATKIAVEDWKVHDPVGQSEEVFREVANVIEQRVMRLILELRTGKRSGPLPGSAAARS
ncbi:MAG: arsenate reductase ArsC [Acidobacteriota bacterium]|nr:arsenate reductase ArsC [Acidobacteriota bacterium]